MLSQRLAANEPADLSRIVENAWRENDTDDGKGDPEDAGKTHYPSIFLSDIHLGTKDCQAELLLEFLKTHSCDRLYLVGDIIDGWRLKSSFYWPQSHNDVLRRFLTLAKRGTKVIYITGNHDEFLRRYSELTLGNLELLDEAEHRTIDGRRLLVIHGDQFDVVTLHHRWLAFLGDRSYGLLLRLNRIVNVVRKQLGFEYWSIAKYLKHKVKRAVNFIGEFEETLMRQCRRRGFDGVVCGHIHHAEITAFENVTYLNCGDWVESCTALLEGADGQFQICRWGEASARAAAYAAASTADPAAPLQQPFEDAVLAVATEGDRAVRRSA